MANYTTETKVRVEAGLVNNSNILDANLLDLIGEAHAEIQGRISARYQLSGFTVNFSGSQAALLLGRIETLLAAGYALQREYPQEQGDDSEGDSRVQRALALLDAIMSGKTKLLDSNGNEYGLTGSGRSGLTLEHTFPETDDTERPAQFAINQVF